MMWNLNNTMTSEQKSTTDNGFDNTLKKNKSTNTIELLQKEKPPVILQLGDKDDKSVSNNNIKINLGVGIGSRQRKEPIENGNLSYVKAASNNGVNNQQPRVGIISKDKIQQDAFKKPIPVEDEESDDQEHDDDATEAADLCNVFVKYLPQTFSDGDLLELFAPFGVVISCHVMTDKQRDNASMGYGFVRYSSEEEAQQAITALNEKTIGNKRLLCKLSNRVETREKDQQTNLFIRNIPPHYDEEKLKYAFEVFGPITKVKIMLDQNTQKSKCYGFCE